VLAALGAWHGSLGNFDALLPPGPGWQDQLSALGGDDRLDGGRGDDRLNGEDGYDTLIGGQGLDRMAGGAGPDVLAFLAADDSRVGAGRRDIVTDVETGLDRLDLSAIDAGTRQGGNQN
jgi:Ca2+-binding RTX toxin-like protein